LEPLASYRRALAAVGVWLLGGGRKVTGNFLGEVGFADLKRAIELPLGNAPEAGWVFAISAHGKGFGIEAVQAIHNWGANHFQTDNSVCLIAPENEASFRIAAKMGYRESARTDYKGQPAVILVRSWGRSRNSK
jgi:RimJ/RimL family protein N-acetyltransferase